MIGIRELKLAALLGLAGALALSTVPAQARVLHEHIPAVHDSFAYAPPSRTSHFIDDGVGYSGTGTFSDGRQVPGTNWNPNEG